MKSPANRRSIRRRRSGAPRARRNASASTQSGHRRDADGFAITLDGSRSAPLPAATGGANRAIADAIAAEWEAQIEIIDPLTMPLTRFANSVVDAVVDRVEAVVDDIAKYFGSDLLFYRAGHPETLVAREAAHWDPVLFWAADVLGAHFILAEGVVHVRQPEPGRLRRRARRCRTIPGRSRRYT